MSHTFKLNRRTLLAGVAVLGCVAPGAVWSKSGNRWAGDAVRRFSDADWRTRLPPAAYIIAPQDTAVVTLLRLHGVRVDRSDSTWTARGETFTIDSIITASRAFQGHHEVRLKGTWQRGLQPLPPKSFIVSTAQPRGVLIVYILEPESDDGFTTWNFFDADLKKGGRFPVTRIFDLPRRGRAAARRSSASASPLPQD